MKFQTLYNSPWLATALVAAVTMVGLVVWLRRRSFIVAFTVLFTIEILGDALRSGSWSPLHLLASPWEDPIGALFVGIGDFRYYLLAERFAVRPKTTALDATAPKAFVTALAWMAIVPIVSLSLAKWVPTPFAEDRCLYLTWEVTFLGVIALYRFLRLAPRLGQMTPAVRTWLLDITRFEMVLYLLWAAADVAILFNVDVAFGFRVVPNVMYYGLFLWFVALRAPREVEA